MLGFALFHPRSSDADVKSGLQRLQIAIQVLTDENLDALESMARGNNLMLWHPLSRDTNPENDPPVAVNKYFLGQLRPGAIVHSSPQQDASILVDGKPEAAHVDRVCAVT
ncbi:hypothetical protein PINS_up023944 [Pythium insidiosum]|nr:hypothetical protein PINS_up023944 [Pythium insidiosum]